MVKLINIVKERLDTEIDGFINLMTSLDEERFPQGSDWIRCITNIIAPIRSPKLRRSFRAVQNGTDGAQNSNFKAFAFVQRFVPLDTRPG